MEGRRRGRESVGVGEKGGGGFVGSGGLLTLTLSPCAANTGTN